MADNNTDLDFSGVITAMKAKFEEKSNKVSSITDSIKTSTTAYPSVKAFVSYLTSVLADYQDKDSLDSSVGALGYIKSAPEQQQADWTETDTSSLSFIKNKPTDLADFADDEDHRLVTDDEKDAWDAKAEVSDIPTKTSDLTNDSNYVSDSNYTHIDVDSLLSTTSTNPVQNKVISARINAVSDSIPTALTDLADLTGDSTHRLVTDAQMDNWDQGGTAVQPEDIEDVVREGDSLAVLDNTTTQFQSASQVATAVATKTITVAESTPTSGDFAKVYTLYQGGQAISPAINIPKDLVIKSGSIVTVDNVKYLRLVLNNDQTVDIPVGDLCDVYTADNVTLELNNHQFSIKESYMQDIIDDFAAAINAIE